jgi:hypothetical protein
LLVVLIIWYLSIWAWKEKEEKKKH